MGNINVKRHIFEFVSDHETRYNYQPTLSELRKMFAGFGEDVDLHLEQLEREGLLHLGGDGKARVARTFPALRRINLRGLTAKPFAPENQKVPSSLALDLSGAGIALDGDLFGHVVDDDSMSDAGIRAGDIAILRAALPGRGEIVAVEESGRMVLRRYVVISGIPHLLAENLRRPDLAVAYEKSIHGVLWCLICANPNGLRDMAPPSRKISYPNDKTSALGAEFVAMLQRELKGSPKPQSQKKISARARNISATKTARKPRTPHEKKWPSPPSGIALNDRKSSAYHARPEKLLVQL